MKKIISLAFLSFFAILAIGFASLSPVNAATGPFTTNLSFGVQAPAQIKLLQRFLNAQGVYSGPITGNFLNLTMQGVKQFQIENNIVPSTGYFGPLTRAKANTIALSENPEGAAVAVATPATTISNGAANMAPKTAAATAAPATTAGPSESLLAYVQMQLNSMFETVRNLGQRIFGHSSISGSESVSNNTSGSIAPTVISSGGGGGSSGGGNTGTGSSGGGGGGTVSVAAATLAPVPAPSVPAPIPPAAITLTVPATTTLILQIAISGGTALPKNFNVTVKDNAVSSIIFSGAGSATTAYTLTVGHSYAVTETATTQSANYTIALSSGCAGVVTISAPTCTITNTYAPPAGSGSSDSASSGASTTTATSSSSSSSSGSTGNAGESTGSSSGSGSQTTVTTASGLLWGAYSGDTPSALGQIQSLVGAAPNIQAIFLSMGIDSFPSGYTQSVGAAGKTLLIFWEPDNGSDDVNQSAFSYSSILSGQYDANMTQFAAAAKAYGYPIILVPMDEMNGNWDPWCGTVNGNTPAQFTQVWIHVHNLFAGVSNVKFGWDPNDESVPDTSANAISAYWPGAQYVDYVGVDGFNGNGDPWQSFSQVFPSSLMTQLASYGKPVFIFSMGSTENSTNPLAKAQWITQGLGPNGMVSTFPDLAGWVWFNENGGDSTSNWSINSDPASLAAFQAAIP